MDYCLVEQWHESYTFPANTRAVALNERAQLDLERCGISYVPLEDFYTSYEVRGNTDEFLLAQLAWYDDFDKQLKEAFPEAQKLGINLATIYYFTIKYLTDNVILSTRILRKFIESAKPGKIFFYGPKYTPEEMERLLESDPSGHPFGRMLDQSFTVGESPFSQLIEPLCKDRGIAYERLAFNAPVPVIRKPSFLRSLKATIHPRTFKASLKKILPVSKLKNYYRGLKICIKSQQANLPKGRIFVLGDLMGTMDFVMDSRKYGFDIYFETGKAAKKLSLSHLGARGIETGLHDPAGYVACEDLFHKILRGDVMRWINNLCGIDVSHILKSRFKYFYFDICPELLARIKDYKEFYVRNNIDFVATPNIWTVDEHAAIAAARLTPSTKSIGFAHGSDAYECKSRFFYVNRQYDIFFSPSASEAEHEKSLVKEFNYAYPQVHEFSYLFRKLTRMFPKDQKIRPVVSAGGRRVVLFVPIIYGATPGRSVQKNQPFPAEFVQWHKALAEYFSKRKDIFFIWKALIQPGQSVDLMAEIIRKNNYENIQFDSHKVTKWFPYIDRVLCDIPSTVFFEAIYGHKPVLALYRPQYQILRENAKNGYGSSLRAMNDYAEGVKMVEEFLDGPREKYIVPYKLPNVFVPEILESYLNITQNAQKVEILV
ncbi:MAG TPA: hypothetical protein VI749_06960 [Candidatus Omnitrophota bacterium]|nr:hypothetical protein [Candidatus Omnitrophota bacterium]